MPLYPGVVCGRLSLEWGRAGIKNMSQDLSKGLQDQVAVSHLILGLFSDAFWLNRGAGQALKTERVPGSSGSMPVDPGDVFACLLVEWGPGRH